MKHPTYCASCNRRVNPAQEITGEFRQTVLEWWAKKEERTFVDLAKEFDVSPSHARSLVHRALQEAGIDPWVVKDIQGYRVPGRGSGGQLKKQYNSKIE